ncbi:hydroxymethylglutaryl-CoA reductase [Colletotrichum higginsianum]|uniref:hydroxymethylglutaryl-CoA reductase (NADPH) n=1 Tax=Colletotrichum higginsianum (strain IMI 349063) TaxID=759273 RepID=H1V437_COLHI|nr:Hydroxymethylglutaryl-CoA reductase [Colletotrichum higginsianum IMI 349063]OBR08104.1 Hydroxymethylglutaryl-CoA reductase [Colletotrichum higginsianum IMI 349063]GJC97807.1 hydroxymethylglutaryl-CoA reductase [Colletotrichum higginsianum]CCF34989.1 hydroxymethylglutaryl-CoA reductase [Colletotrichum higginsianum]
MESNTTFGQSVPPMAAPAPQRRQSSRSDKIRSLVSDYDLSCTSKDDSVLKGIKVENLIGFSQVPLGLAGPLDISGPNLDTTLFAPLATYEPTLVASCSRGCKAFNLSGGLNFEILAEGMSRAPVFTFDNPGHALAFARAIPSFRASFAKWAESTSSHARLQDLRPSVIGSQVHLFCSYHCGGAAGQNMVTKATKHACDMLLSLCRVEFSIREFLIEGNVSSDKKPSWGNVKTPRGVEVMAWGTLTPEASQSILGVSTERLYWTHQAAKEGGIRNGQFGSNFNTTNIIAAMFISTGQDPASVAEGSSSHLTSELDPVTKNLTMSLYIPSLPVGTVGGGTGYSTQKEALKLLECAAPDMKGRLAGVIASFALALDLSTSAAIANDTFTRSHMALARGERLSKL